MITQLADSVGVLESLTTAAQPWADRVADSPLLATGLIAVHVLAIFTGGGLAIAADRRVLRATRDANGSAASIVSDLRDTHTPVIVALCVAVASGALLFLSDVATFGVSRVFWAKLSLIALLLANGVRMRRTERRMQRALAADDLTLATTPGISAGATIVITGVRTLRGAAAFSLFAWFGVVLLGVILGNS